MQEQSIIWSEWSGKVWLDLVRDHRQRKFKAGVGINAAYYQYPWYYDYTAAYYIFATITYNY